MLIRDDYPLFGELLDLYYHQDFDVDAGSDEHALALYFAGSSSEHVRSMLAELRALRSHRPTEVVVDWLRGYPFERTHLVFADGGLDAWLARMEDLVRETLLRGRGYR